MNEYTVQYSPLSGSIYAGRVNKAGTAFTSKNNVTMPAMLAVADRILKEYDGEIELTSPDEPGYRIRVERIPQ